MLTWQDVANRAVLALLIGWLVWVMFVGRKQR